MSNTNTQIFSQKQARQTLPLIRSIVNDAMSCQQSLKGRINDQFADSETPSFPSDTQNVPASDQSLRNVKQKLKEYVHELYQIGAELHDFEEGRVDFPSRLEDRIVYLCWEQGEDDVRHWHEVYESCRQRRMIEDQRFDA